MSETIEQTTEPSGAWNWIKETQAALAEHEKPKLPSDQEFGKMYPELRKAKVKLIFWYCDGKGEQILKISFFDWLKILRGEGYVHRTRPEKFEGDPIYPEWEFYKKSVEQFDFRFGDYKEGFDYDYGSIYDLIIEGPVIDGVDVAKLSLAIRDQLLGYDLN